jgi:hypothetical protein
MKKRTLIIAIALVAIIGLSIAFTVQRRERRAIDAGVFAEMRKNPWDLNGDLLWGFYFTNETKWPLEFDAWALGLFGYSKVSIDRDEKKEFWWLHVEKIERLSLDSMASRNVRLSWFGKIFGFSVYDGWDVGPVGFKPEANKALVPTATSVTPAADAPVAPAAAAAHL